jgi:hypothetical protein
LDTVVVGFSERRIPVASHNNRCSHSSTRIQRAIRSLAEIELRVFGWDTCRIPRFLIILAHRDIFREQEEMEIRDGDCLAAIGAGNRIFNPPCLSEYQNQGTMLILLRVGGIVRLGYGLADVVGKDIRTRPRDDIMKTRISTSGFSPLQGWR